jgi:TonB-linked SusC/RagA family outer membrane protein
MTRLAFMVIMLTSTLTGVLLAREVKSQSISETKVSIDLNRAYLREAFLQLEKQSGFRFYYDNEVGRMKEITLKENTTMDVVLKKLADQMHLRFTEENNLIAVTKSPLPPPPGSIRGHIVAFETGEPLPGASVRIVELNRGMASDEKGGYRLEAIPPGKYTLLVSFVSFTAEKIPIEVKAGSELTIDVKLKPSGTMKEVVVTALNMKRDLNNTGYLVEGISGNDVNNNKTVSIENALAGKIAGVDVSNTSNGVAGSKRITIRGVSSISGNNTPLWVVDGIPINASPISTAAASGGGGIDFGDGLTDINPDDIASITVLKGNAAAALYGSRASTGVIIVTTKSGADLAKNKVRVDLSSSYTVDKAIDYSNWQYQYGQGTAGVKPVSLQDALSTTANWGAKLDGSPVMQFDGQMRPYSAQKNNFSNFFKDGETFTNAVSLSGNTGYTNYRLSASDMSNSDIVPNTSYDRYIFSFNIHTKVKNLSVNAVANYTSDDAINRQNVGGNTGNVFWTLLNLPTNLNVLNLKPGVNASGNELGLTSVGYPTNPYFETYDVHEDDQRRRFNASLEVRYDFTNWLYARGRILEDYFDYNETNYTPIGVIWSPKGGGLTQNSENNAEENYEFIVGTSELKLPGKIKISTFVGGNIYNTLLTTTNINGTPFVLPDVYTVNNLAVKYPSTGYYQQRTNSLFGNVDLSWQELSLNITGRQDWFSTLPVNSDALFYPSASLSYTINNTYFPAWLSSAKVRGSIAQVSGGASPYQLTPSYALDANTYNGISLQSIGTSTVPNANLKPLLSTENEFGTDLDFFKNKVSLSLTYYSRKTTQDIVNTAVSIASGYSNAVLNVGQMTNQGIETSLKVNVINSSKFSWDITGLFSYNQNDVVSLGNNISTLQLGQSKTGNAFIDAVKGYAYDQIEGYTYSYNAKGQIIYGSNGLPVINSKLQNLGSGIYKQMASISNIFRYKNFTLDFLIDSKFGAKIYSEENSLAVGNGLSTLTLPGRGNGLVGNGVNAAGSPNTVLVTPANLLNYYATVAQITQNFVYDASFIKLREVSLGYAMPNEILSKTPFSRLNLSLIGRNLLILYKKTPNMDPESNTTADNAQGLQAAVYPPTRNIGLSLKASF